MSLSNFLEKFLLLDELCHREKNTWLKCKGEEHHTGKDSPRLTRVIIKRPARLYSEDFSCYRIWQNHAA